MTYSIQTLNNISDKGTSLLPSAKYVVTNEAENPDAILLRSFKMHNREIPISLKAVGRAGAGVNNIPLDKMSDAGIAVFNAPGANANAVKELVIAGMLMACRNLVLARDFAVKLEGADEGITKQVEAGKNNFGGFELPGQTLGVVGLGAIGVLVANAAISLGMRVIGFDPLISIDKAWELDSKVEKANDIQTLLQESNFVTFHVPLIDATSNLINTVSLQTMKDNVIILNFARNGIVNDEAVCSALDTGKAYAYVCDFPSNLLNNHPRVIALPHIGASTLEAEENCAIMVVNDVRNYLEDGTIHNSVNMPAISLPREGETRLAMIHKNIPDMVGQVSHILGKAGANIMSMINGSRADVAVTLMDLESVINDTTEAEISAIDGMLRLRVI